MVGETRFDDLAAAEAHSAEKKRELAEYGEKAKARIAANMEKYKELRAAGKDYYSVIVKHDHGCSSHKVYHEEWLNEEMASAKRAEQDTQVKQGKLLTNESVKTTAEIDAALAAGKEIKILYL